jgi:uncharacterized membrane protein YeaQ/YmgE (transglycosylase-associated protein family)
MVLNILLWCLFGLVAGAVAQFIMPGKDPGESGDVRGFLITIALGIVGALVGGWLSSQLFGWNVNDFSLPGFAVAVAGAVLLLILYRVLRAATRNA